MQETLRDTGSIPGSGRSPGGGHGNPLQYFCLENPHGQRSWRGAIVHGVTKSQTQLSMRKRWKNNKDSQDRMRVANKRCVASRQVTLQRLALEEQQRNPCVCEAPWWRRGRVASSPPTLLWAFTCWVLRAGSMPSDWHTRLSSPVSAPELSHASQPQPTAFYAARRKYLGQPGQSLQFERRWGKTQSDYRKPVLQIVKLIQESQDFKTDPLQPICIVQDKGMLCSSPELKQSIWNYVQPVQATTEPGWT